MARSVAGRRTAAAALPEWIRPQLTQLLDAAPDGPEWLHEIKFDGYRMHARLDRGAVRLLTRTGLDWTHKYPAIAAAVASLGAGSPLSNITGRSLPSPSRQRTLALHEPGGGSRASVRAPHRAVRDRDRFRLRWPSMAGQCA